LIARRNRDNLGPTVREALEAVFTDDERLRGYVFNDQSALRCHMAIVVDRAIGSK
jgi:hypothetical protein